MSPSSCKTCRRSPIRQNHQHSPCGRRREHSRRRSQHRTGRTTEEEKMVDEQRKGLLRVPLPRTDEQGYQRHEKQRGLNENRPRKISVLVLLCKLRNS